MNEQQCNLFLTDLEKLYTVNKDHYSQTLDRYLKDEINVQTYIKLDTEYEIKRKLIMNIIDTFNFRKDQTFPNENAIVKNKHGVIISKSELDRIKKNMQRVEKEYKQSMEGE